MLVNASPTFLGSAVFPRPRDEADLGRVTRKVLLRI
jgi:hypothetical protein